MTMKENVTSGVVTEPVKLGSVDVEAFSQNLARMVENGGKAPAAYLRPREQGKAESGPSDEVADLVKTLGQVLEYWLAHPPPPGGAQSGPGRALPALFGSG